MLAAAVGPMRFVLVGATYGRLPRLTGPPLGVFDGVELASVCERGACYLVADHRRGPARPARIVAWRPDGPHEGIRALIVVAEAARAPAAAPLRTIWEAVVAAEATHQEGRRPSPTVRR